MAIVVRKLESVVEGTDFVCSAEVTLDGRERLLSFRRYGNHPELTRRTDTFDAHAVALLVPAMIRGEPLVIEGDIDEMLLVALRGLVQSALRLMAPGWARVPVEAGARPAARVTDWTRGAATAVSGGIDSMHLIRHRLLAAAVPEPLRVKVFVHHHVGAHDEDHGLFAERYDHARRIADRLGIPVVGARCDLGTAYRGMSFIHSVTPRNVAGSFSLDHLFSTFLYASTEPLGERPVMNRMGGISILDGLLLPLFNTTRVSWLPFGGDTTRLRKSAEVIADDRLCADLNVCVRGDRRARAALNCGRCYKCARVLLHAAADGRFEAVAGTFDIAAFRRGLGHSLGRLIRVSLLPRFNPNDVDLLQYLHARRYPFPLWARPGVKLAILRHGRRHSLAA